MINIIFYNFHVNGDCFTSRILVKHFIENIKNANYYYTSPRSLSSHCLDIGIPDDNFNIYSLPYNAESFTVLFLNNCLYINTWIGKCSKFCIWCLDSYIKHYNQIIDNINHLNVNIDVPNIKTDLEPFVKYDYSLYTCKFFNDYFNDIKSKFSKIILIYNCTVTTYVNVNNITHVGYLDQLTEKYPDFFFITFSETNIKKHNIICATTIYEEKSQKSINYGIEFSYLASFCNKIILLPSGVCQFGFYNEINVRNKYAILYCKCSEVKDNHVCDEEVFENLCIEKYNLFVKKIWINKTRFEIMNEIEEFILLPTIYE